MSGDITKLPKWARHEIEMLRANLDSARKREASALGLEPSRVEVDPYMHSDGDRIYLTDKSTVRFTIEGGQVDVHLDNEGMLFVYGNHFEGHLCVLPHSGNTLNIAYRKDLR